MRKRSEVDESAMQSQEFKLMSVSSTIAIVLLY